MNRQQCYHLCCQYNGKVVRIQDKSGNYHIGRITKVSDDSVWIEPIRQRYNRGFGYIPYDEEVYGYDSDRYGYEGRYCRGGCDDDYYGGAYALGLGFIVGIALAALFFF
ncbi:hypothetical protein P6P90_09860 [Ectobacillus antri]|jgi:hypothetical protein|uniref:Uncharacterized protein n=1 Tax=Ectobacillus antri TaxID=2486280 RepID=A0ABT6H4H3_9BACI|nr:hypothetical protein [Ectobacillus antri]MDG4656828.1 hypothetical protein [Ectobacillus antri]MDG5754275.1 hypothetical protein [Ectobacillus antri]